VPSRDAASYRFAVGQAVRLKGGFRSSARPGDIYHITGTLPPQGVSPQYRIRNDDERHERVATQESIELVSLPGAGDGTTLIERTFGHGQGTETRQSRDQKTEAAKGSAET
jgi:hypothetical protein